MAMTKFLLLATLAIVCMASTVSAAKNCTLSKTCEDCVKSFECYWCAAGNRTNGVSCHKRTTFQLTAKCNTKYYLYPTCKLDGLTLLILVAAGLSIFFILLITCVYCCCCKSRSSARMRRDDERESTLRGERTRRQEERRQERASRIDDIRKKYGLGTDERYQKM